MSEETNPLDEHLNLLLTDNITKDHQNLIGQLLKIESLIDNKQEVDIESKPVLDESNTVLKKFKSDVNRGVKTPKFSIGNLSFDSLLRLIGHHKFKPKFSSKTIKNIWEMNSSYTSGKQSTFYDYKGSEQEFVTLVNDVFPTTQNVVSIILPHSQNKLSHSHENNFRNGSWQHITIDKDEFNEPLSPLIWDVILDSLHLSEASKTKVLYDLFEPEKPSSEPEKPSSEPEKPSSEKKKSFNAPLNIINISKKHKGNSKLLNVPTVEATLFNNLRSNNDTHLIANYEFPSKTFKNFSLLTPKKPQNTQGMQSLPNDVKAIRQSLSYLLCQTSGHIITVKLNKTNDANASLITPFWWNETIKALRVENNPSAKSYVQPDYTFIDLCQYAQLSNEEVYESRERLKKFFDDKSTASERKKAFESLINSNGFNKPNFPSLSYPYID